MDNWISVDDRLPEGADKLVLVHRVGKHGAELLTAYHFPPGEFAVMYGDHYDDITHWMPLPDPPKTKWRTLNDVFKEKFGEADDE